MRNLKSAGGYVDDAELVIREIGRLHAHWWGDARLDKTPWLQMKGMMTPNEHHWYSPRIGSVFGQALHSGARRADLGWSTLCALPACTSRLDAH